MHTVSSWVFFDVWNEENGKTRNGYGCGEWEWELLLCNFSLCSLCSWCCCLFESVKAHLEATDKHLAVAPYNHVCQTLNQCDCDCSTWRTKMFAFKNGLRHFDVCMRAYMCVCVSYAIHFKVVYIFYRLIELISCLVQHDIWFTCRPPM